MTQIKLGDQTVDLSGQLPTVGSQAPDFLLADNELVNMTLKDFEVAAKIQKLRCVRLLIA